MSPGDPDTPGGTADGGAEVVLVGCSASKQTGVHRAADLYEPSRLFRRRRALARRRGDRWAVLSARHGLLWPHEAVADYDTRIEARTPAWAAHVLRRLLPALDRLPTGRVTVLAGRAYVEPVAGPLRRRGWTVADPHAGLAIGERLAALGEALAPGRRATLDEFVPSGDGPAADGPAGGGAE